MKEAKLGRYAVPFDKSPFKNYIQSPIGLVPKAGNKTRLIFHLSFAFGEDRPLVNECIPDEFCSVKYKDLSYTVKMSLRLMWKRGVDQVFYAKTDLTSAFRILPIRRDQQCWLLLKAHHPITGEICFFIEKNLPFGASLSCRLFQEFSSSLKYIFESITNTRWQVCCYLDDYLLVEETEEKCNRLVDLFINFCAQINCPLSPEKTERATSQIIFLGILLDGKHQVLGIPVDKKEKALHMI